MTFGFPGIYYVLLAILTLISRPDYNKMLNFPPKRDTFLTSECIFIRLEWIYHCDKFMICLVFLFKVIVL